MLNQTDGLSQWRSFLWFRTIFSLVLLRSRGPGLADLSLAAMAPSKRTSTGRKALAPTPKKVETRSEASPAVSFLLPFARPFGTRCPT